MEEKKIRHGEVDVSYFADISPGNPSFLTDMLQLFLQQIPDETQKMNDAFDSGDYKTLNHFSHKLKSTVRMLKFNELADLLAEIERMADEQTDLKDIKPLLSRVNALMYKLIVGLEEIIKSYR
jgi:HPt (histidine-containing phosphotransfer) domain-containing protein